MIKTIAYFPEQCALNAKPILEGMLSSLRRYGIQIKENALDADAAIIWSVLWHGRMKNNKSIYTHYRSQNKPVICIDVGALYRGTTWKIAINNITADGYYGQNKNLDLDRPRKLNISLADSLRPEPYILVAAQHRSSLQVEHIDIETWISNQIKLIRQNCDRPIRVRAHPRCPLRKHLLPTDVEFEIPHKVPDTYDTFDMHYNCHAVVNYNSGPGIQSAISGVRPVVDVSSLAAPVSVSAKDIETPYLVDRNQWLIELCHTEYTLEEIKKGTWINRLLT